MGYCEAERLSLVFVLIGEFQPAFPGLFERVDLNGQGDKSGGKALCLAEPDPRAVGSDLPRLLVVNLEDNLTSEFIDFGSIDSLALHIHDIGGFPVLRKLILRLFDAG